MTMEKSPSPFFCREGVMIDNTYSMRKKDPPRVKLFLGTPPAPPTHPPTVIAFCLFIYLFIVYPKVFSPWRNELPLFFKIECWKIPKYLGMFQFPPFNFYFFNTHFKEKSMLHDPYHHNFLQQYFLHFIGPGKGGWERGAYLANSWSICCPQLRAFRTQFPLISGLNSSHEPPLE